MTNIRVRRPGLVSSLPAGTIQSYGVPVNAAREPKAKPDPKKALAVAEKKAAKKAPAEKRQPARDYSAGGKPAPAKKKAGKR